MKSVSNNVVLLLSVFGLTTTKLLPENCDIRFEDNGVCACSSYDKSGIVKCKNHSRKVEIQPCYCMYYDATLNLSTVGHCYFSCHQLEHKTVDISTSSEFNENYCGHYGFLHRTGRFCGQCNSSDYGLAAYSYQLIRCTPCRNHSYKNWLRYFAISLLPLTVFYILALLLSFNVTSSKINGMVLVIQCITSPAQMTMLKTNPYIDSHNTWISVLLKVAISLISITNLDFFRFVYPPFCLHPKANVLEIMSLDYIVALYPFFLILLTYVLITAHDRQYRLVVWVWRPFKSCIHRYRKTWKIKTSLIEMFATFILLSYVKILGTSFQVFSFTATFGITGKSLNEYFLSSDANIAYFGSTHLPFVLLAMVISVVFVVLPLLLVAFYPCRCFHWCLERCRLRSQTLHIFMDAFQGSYRTEPHDMRFFSAFYLLVRISILIQTMLFPSTLKLFTSGILSLASAGVVAIFQPYKVKGHNTMDSIWMLLMGGYFISYHEVLILTALDYGKQWVLAAVINVLSIVCLLIMLVFLMVWIIASSWIKAVVRKIMSKLGWLTLHHHINDSGCDEVIESFDRDIGQQSNSYSPLPGSSQRSTY